MRDLSEKHVGCFLEVHVCTPIDSRSTGMYITLHTTSSARCVMNRTSLARRTQIINCLVEGNSIRSTERITDTHRDTIMRLMVEVGNGCAALANDQTRNLNCQRIQCDEIWSYVGKKQMHLQRGDDRHRLGDQWTFVAID